MSTLSLTSNIYMDLPSGLGCRSLSCHDSVALLLFKVTAILQVPPGTVVRLKDDGDDKALAEVLQDGDRALLFVGGRGGRGNASFKSQRNKYGSLLLSS